MKECNAAPERAGLHRNGSEEGRSDAKPLGTVTTRDRFGLVYVHGEPYAIADIGMRMLQPRELFRAQGFPDTYVISPAAEISYTDRWGRKRIRTGGLTKTAQIRMCGNSVCPPIACALISANFAGEKAAVA